jgi:hypothetical protein
VELKLNWTHQLVAYADDKNLLGDNIETRTLIDVTKKVVLEVNTKINMLSRTRAGYVDYET